MGAALCCAVCCGLLFCCAALSPRHAIAMGCALGALSWLWLVVGAHYTRMHAWIWVCLVAAGGALGAFTGLTSVYRRYRELLQRHPGRSALAAPHALQSQA